MPIFVPIWKECGVPEPIYDKWVRSAGDAIAAARCRAYRRRVLEHAHAALEEEKRLAAQAYRRGPQVTPDNDIGAEILYEMSPYTYEVLHQNSLVEGGCEGGEYIQSEDYMRWWLKRNEQCKRKTAPHENRIGYTARLEKAKAEGETNRLTSMALATQILQDAAEAGRKQIIV